MTTTLIGIPASSLVDCWDGIKHLIDDACTRSNGKYQGVDILKSLLRGDMQLWGAVSDEKIEAIAIGEIINYPRVRIYRVLAATGSDMGDWTHHISGIENWARVQGCEEFECIARPGWEKVFKDYRKTHVILNRNLNISGTVN